MLNERLKAARTAAGLSLRALADEVGVSAMALSKYERGVMRPSPSVIEALAKALRVPPAHLTDNAPLELTGVEYRASSRMTPVSKRLIHDEIRKQIGLRRELEALVPEIRPPALSFPPRPSRIVSMDAIEDVAEGVRDAWGLGAQPISNLTNLLEAHGVRVVYVTIRDGWFDGLAARVDEWPVVVVGADWPGDRQRFTLAHELGHLVLGDRLKDGLDEERACHRFAGAFLAPKSAVKQIFVGQSVSPVELALLKHEWGLSMGAWLYRLQDVGRIDQETFRALWRTFRKNGWNKTEPGPALARESATCGSGRCVRWCSTDGSQTKGPPRFLTSTSGHYRNSWRAVRRVEPSTRTVRTVTRLSHQDLDARRQLLREGNDSIVIGSLADLRRRDERRETRTNCRRIELLHFIERQPTRCFEQRLGHSRVPFSH